MKNKLVMAIFSVLILSGCSDDPPEDPALRTEPSPRIYSTAIAVECLLSGGLIPESDLKDQIWLKDGKVDMVIDFSTWTSDHTRTVYGEKTLSEWTDEVIAAGKNWKCPFAETEAVSGSPRAG